MRNIVEEPFGCDLESAFELIRVARTVFLENLIVEHPDQRLSNVSALLVERMIRLSGNVVERTVVRRLVQIAVAHVDHHMRFSRSSSNR